jgi:hypothetical protein
MHRFVLTSLLVSATASAVSAQQGTPPDAEAQTAPPGQVIMTAPSQTSVSQVYFDYDLKEAEARSRRTRNALIATSAVTGVGIILLGVGYSQCEEGDPFNDPDQWVCNDAGDVLVGLGAAFAGAGTIGMITSGIMLGVRNKQKREIQRDMRRRSYGSRFQWDIPSGRLVF